MHVLAKLPFSGTMKAKEQRVAYLSECTAENGQILMITKEMLFWT